MSRENDDMVQAIETMRSSLFMPHGMCFLWQPGVLWLHAIADTVIAICTT